MIHTHHSPLEVAATRRKDAFCANVLYLAMAALLVLVSLVSGLFGQALHARGIQLAPYGASFLVIMLISEAIPILLPGLALLLLRGGRPLGAGLRLRFRPIALLAIPTAVFGYLFASGLATLWGSLWQALGAAPEASIALPANGGQLLVGIAAVALWPALCEEFLFRGMIMPAYEGYLSTKTRAAVLSGVIFGLMHGQVSGAPAHIAMGIVMGLLVLWTDSLWTAILYHLTSNSIAMVLGLFQQKFAATDIGAQVLGAQPALGDMLLAGGLYVLMGGAVLIALLCIFYTTRAAQTPPPAAAPTCAPALPGSGVARAGRLSAWWPLLAGLAIALGRYVLSFLEMFAGRLA